MANQNLTEISSQTSLSEPSSEDLQICSDLLSFIAGAPSPYHVTASFAGMLDAAGFVFLRETEDWPLVPGGKYYVTRNDSSLIAFCVPQEQPLRFQITAAHSDSPSFRVKTNPYVPCAGEYICLNVEKYGGAILSSWLDRPLSLAGRVMVRENRPEEAFSSDPFTKSPENSVMREDGRCEIRSHLVNLDRDLVLIPNLAIHMNRKINEGYAYQIQKDMLPLFGSLTADGKLEELIARELGCAPDQILGFDLFLYNRTPGSIWGALNEYISSPKLDDLQCAYSTVRALIETAKQGAAASQSICVAAVFDNEEVGSLTAQGADSTFLEDTLTRIWMSLRPSSASHGPAGFSSCADCTGRSDRTDHSDDVASDSDSFTGQPQPAALDPSVSLRMALAGSFLISADNAHALHPHHAEKADPTHRPLMNGGPVIKFSANQKYTTDAFSSSVFKTICQKAGVPWQVFHNHSDQPGGSTLGNLSNAHVSLHAVDIGLPQLSMHSPYETAGARDTGLLIRALEAFYRTAVIIEGDRICFQ